MCLTKKAPETAALQLSGSRDRKKSAQNEPIMVSAVPSSSFSIVSDSEHEPARDDFRPDSPTKIFVTHEYHDHAYERDPTDCGDEDYGQESGGCKRRGPRGGVAHPFPEKLHLMLSSVEEDGLDHIVSWHPHGRSFAVHKPKEFVAEIM